MVTVASLVVALVRAHAVKDYEHSDEILETGKNKLGRKAFIATNLRPNGITLNHSFAWVRIGSKLTLAMCTLPANSVSGR